MGDDVIDNLIYVLYIMAEQIYGNIQQLQTLEQQVINNIDDNTNLSVDDKKKLLDKLNQLSTMRLNLYKSVYKMKEASDESLRRQHEAIRIIEKELSRSKKRIRQIEEEKNNQIRLIEIDSYYQQQYEERGEFVKVLFFVVFPMAVLTVLYNKGYVWGGLYMLLMGVVVLVGGWYLLDVWVSILWRDNMDYNAYMWPAPRGVTSSPPVNNEQPMTPQIDSYNEQTPQGVNTQYIQKQKTDHAKFSPDITP